MYNISRGLLDAGHELTILCIETPKHPFREDLIVPDFLERTRMKPVYVDTRINVVDAFSSLVTDDSYNISRFFSPDFDIRLTDLLKKEKFNVVHLESLFMTPYIPSIRRNSKARVVLRSHNLEHIIWERLAGSTRNILKRSYLQLLSRQIRRHEMAVLKDVDGIAAITPEDAAKYIDFGFSRPLVTVPFGLFLNDYPDASHKVQFPGLFHLGSMDWKPNEEGIQWFLEQVWPLVMMVSPDVKLYLAGRNMPVWMVESGLHNVVVDGEVPDAREYIAQHQVMIVPLLSAGGMRVKIIEGMAMGKCVISTTIGAEGIDFEDGKHMLIANTPDELIASIKRLFSQPEQIAAIGRNARKLVEERYNYRSLSDRLVEFYEMIPGR
jgi:glycosyltransferase involved in cell wall biosynthesis